MATENPNITESELLVRDEIVATPLHYELYDKNTSPYGALMLKHEKGYRLLVHYHDQFYFEMIRSFLDNKPEEVQEPTHYLGYYKNGIFKVVHEWHPDNVEDFRRFYPNLER